MRIFNGRNDLALNEDSVIDLMPFARHLLRSQNVDSCENYVKLVTGYQNIIRFSNAISTSQFNSVQESVFTKDYCKLQLQRHIYCHKAEISNLLFDQRLEYLFSVRFSLLY